ncbi:hypothetical protein GCM10011410_30360 [Hoyosella rhizosphaerae]|uniref:DUF559 domain-containing protein n=1 Tax=Hoyosella rhizosphaerae TaxID=1755582 RepID=A0A916UIN9_9ACTN|nr:hypothetical protein GCM10011410_30360 [Hoyosella rhizosphaerae]
MYLAHNGEPTPHQHLWITVLAAPPGSALGGLTAAHLDGLRGFETERHHLVVPSHARRTAVTNVHLHWSHRLGQDDVHPNKQPPRTRLPRSLVDAASWMNSARGAATVILASVQQRLIRPVELLDAVGKRGKLRHRKHIVEAIADADVGVASLPEQDFARLCIRYRLPHPTRQAVVPRPGGAYYLDADWDEFGTCVEVHGAQHLDQLHWDADLHRQSAIAAGGRRVLQVSSFAIRNQPHVVADLVRRALLTGGWAG